MSILNKYRRWRHSRGFGIHSPFAYRIVKEALYPQRGYQYYAELTPALSDPMDAMAYRLKVLLRSLGYGVEILRYDREIPCRVAPHKALLLIRPTLKKRGEMIKKLETSGKGLVIEGRKYLLIVSRDEMAFTYYDLL